VDSFAVALALINALALLVFVVLVTACLFGMIRRVILYQRARQRLPVVLRRDLALFGALAVAVLELLAVRAFDIQFIEWTRLAFTLQWDALILGGLAYWVKVELFDVDDPDKP
jgi:CDP-diglyceride synthetase